MLKTYHTVWYGEKMRKSKHDWLTQAAHLLAQEGANSLTIERLTHVMGLTKGSFYHHFGSFPKFIEALLAFYETEGTLDVIALTAKQKSPYAKLQVLLTATLREDSALEVGFRAWALQNPQVHEVQARIDAQRLSFLTELCATLTPQADHMAQMLYVLFVGSLQIIPPLDSASLQRLYADVMRLYVADFDADKQEPSL